jgi:hypothetical protein
VLRISALYDRELERTSRRGFKRSGSSSEISQDSVLKFLFAIICLAVHATFLSAGGASAQRSGEAGEDGLNQESPMSELPSAIYRRWTHSREEDTNGLTVFRPSNFNFPPSRGREGMEFRPNGEFVHYNIGATDRSEAVPGRWHLGADGSIEIEFPTTQMGAYRLAVISVDADILIVRRELL